VVKESLEKRIQYLEDIHEIQNLAGRYEYLRTVGTMDQEAMELFALKTPGVRSESAGGGVYEGSEGIRKLCLGAHKKLGGDRTGFIAVHTLTTPVIELAKDGKTAKGVWIAPGCTARKDGETGKLGAYWVWAKVGTDFVKEDGKWKIWHYHVYMIFQTPYEKSWIEPSKFPSLNLPDELKPDRPTTYHKPYSPTGKTELVPVPPEPYETFDEKTAY